jgi:hypothetical protein
MSGHATPTLYLVTQKNSKGETIGYYRGEIDVSNIQKGHTDPYLFTKDKNKGKFYQVGIKAAVRVSTLKKAGKKNLSIECISLPETCDLLIGELYDEKGKLRGYLTGSDRKGKTLTAFRALAIGYKSRAVLEGALIVFINSPQDVIPDNTAHGRKREYSDISNWTYKIVRAGCMIRPASRMKTAFNEEGTIFEGRRQIDASPKKHFVVKAYRKKKFVGYIAETDLKTKDFNTFIGESGKPGRYKAYYTKDVLDARVMTEYNALKYVYYTKIDTIDHLELEKVNKDDIMLKRRER